MLSMKTLLFEKRIPVIWVLAILLFIGMSSFVAIHRSVQKNNVVHIETATVNQDCAMNMDQIREKRQAYIKPLLLTDVLVQDRSMSSLKSELQSYINQKISTNTFEVASVYIRKLDNGAHISINENALFNPASLMKIAYLISFLLEEDNNPGKLQKKLYFDKHYTQGNNQNIVDFTLKEHSYYTIADLLYAMIAYSDNDATALLMQNLNNSIFTQLFSDLQLPPPPATGEYFIGTEDYAKFLRVLYSSTYLSNRSSDYAIRLLLKSTFKDGICSTLDPTIPVAHKFGERVLNNVAQLHEFGIVYYNNSPYLIGVMTKGNNLAPLKKAIGDMSTIVFNYMRANS